MRESMIVGVDHGYAAMKTAHFSFPSGLVAYEHEPYTLKDVLEYGGKFYVVGSGRQALQKNKTQTEDYYLLTLAAIAKELSFRHAEPAVLCIFNLTFVDRQTLVECVKQIMKKEIYYVIGFSNTMRGMTQLNYYFQQSEAAIEYG